MAGHHSDATEHLPSRRRVLLMMSGSILAGCAASDQGMPDFGLDPATQAHYAQMEDDGWLIPGVNPEYLRPELRRTEVDYFYEEDPGTIVVDPYDHKLYLVQEGGRAIRYGVAVGNEGRNFRGGATIRRKATWPSWTPTRNMIRREPEVYEQFAGGVPGGPDNPLGARALYLYRGGRDTYYRIHGTSQPFTIGMSVSSGCIRMFNQDAIDLYDRVPLGTRVVVLSEAESALRNPMTVATVDPI